MFQQESIYNLVPKGKIIPGRGASYTSKYPPTIAPTASTFILGNSSFPGVANMSGDYKFPRGGHPILRDSATFGLPNGQNAANPLKFHKKGETHKIYPPTEKFHTLSSIKKPAVPKVDEPPIMGLKTEKNFIIANAVDNILMQPRKLRQLSVDQPFHKYYGKTPRYIERYKMNHQNELNDMKEMKRRHQEEEDAKQRLLTEAEVNELREGLKKKWEMYNRRYTGLTHKKAFDNLVLLRK